MQEPKIASKEEWLQKRISLLEKEKEFTRLRDDLSKQRRELPWAQVEKEYTFQAEGEEHSLAALFGEKSQLITFHFMFGPSWDEGCKSCTFWADNFNGIPVHLAHRDVSFVVISKAPYEKLKAYKERMGWSFNWYSSLKTDFNEDYNVSFSQDGNDSGKIYHNYAQRNSGMEEAVGVSVFAKDNRGRIFHTYSTYSRGVDMFNGAYHYLDITPKGRDEGNLSYTMEWVRRSDEYGD